MSSNALRDSLWPDDAPNPLVWCERCQKMHRQHTFTQGDYDRIVSDQAKKLSDAIDASIAADMVRMYGL